MPNPGEEVICTHTRQPSSRYRHCVHTQSASGHYRTTLPSVSRKVTLQHF